MKIAETTSLEYTDYTETIVTGPLIAEELLAKYKVSAFLTNNQETLKGNEADVRVKGIPMQKANMNRDDRLNDYYLSQNYPNPFNPSTMICYHLEEDGFVNLKVYNSIGETIAELIDQKQEKGSYSVEFNASTLSSGIYFYKIQTGNFTEVKKMILLR